MKEGTSNIGAGALCYGSSTKGRPDSVLPEDAGLSLRRNKSSRSRFDMEFPPANSAANKWDSEDRHVNRKSILEDYLLEDEETSSQQKIVESDNTRLGQWRSVSADTGKNSSKKKESIPLPCKPPDEATIPQGWQQVQQVAPITNIPPPGFSSYGQPPTYDQGNFYQYDYQQQQQQQYSGYSNYYQGYQDYSQSWAATTEQPPPPGLLLPDMSHPPPMKLPASESVPPLATSPVPAPVSTQAPVLPAAQTSRKHSSSPQSVEHKLKEEGKKQVVKKGQKEQEKELLRQREEYILKSSVLSKELDLLQNQKEQLIEEGASQNSYILKENNKLQDEIKNKLVAIKNVIEMLTGLTGSSKVDHRVEKLRRSESASSSKERAAVHTDSEHKAIKHSSSSESSDEPPDEEKINYSFFDPEEHWCRVCDVFPATAKEYLNHLQSEGHKEITVQKKLVDLPWHSVNPEKERPHYRGAPTRRVPIKGLQFFIAPTAWYCKLCNSWIGDLHCASIHLKSAKHMDNYETYILKNVNWEGQWAAERKAAMSRSEEENRRMQELVRVRQLVDDEDISMPRLESTIRMKEAWGEVIDSPSHIRESIKITVPNDEVVPDPEDMSRSIRVTMRNKAKSKDPAKSLPPMGPALPPVLGLTSAHTKNMEAIPVPPQSNGSAQGQWVVKSAGSNAISESEKQLLKALKDKHKQKQDREDFHKRDERSKDRKKDRRFRERSYERDKSRSRERSRSRSRSRGRDYNRDDDYNESGRSRSRDRRRRRRSSSSRRGRSRSRTPEQRKSKKVEARQWVAPPSSPPPYLQRKSDDKDKWDKPKKKATSNPVPTFSKSKLPFIGRMPSIKKRQKTSDDGEKGEINDSNIVTERRAPEDMEIDSGASDNEQPAITVELPVDVPEAAPPEEEEETAPEPAKPAPGDIPLPQDFQDALSILFPDELPPSKEQPLNLVEGGEEVLDQIPLQLPPAKKATCSISQEELMMLGIDPEDMVAQGLSKS